MPTLRIIIESVNALVLGLWAGALAMVGVAAAFAFPTMKSLDPALPGYASYTGEHWRLAAGAIMNPLFGVVGLIGKVSFLVVCVLLAVLLAKKHVSFRSRTFGVRTVMWLALGALTLYVDRVLWSPMNELFEAHQQFALAGNNEGSVRVMAEFDALHAKASPLMGAQLVIIVSLLVASLVDAFRSPQADVA